MSSRGEIAAGVADAALNSVATLGMGFYAARALEPTSLGAYGLAFTAFVVATRFPSQLIFKPAEIIAVSIPEETRLGLLGRSLTLGVGPAFLAGVALSLWTLLAPASVPGHVILALTVTGALSAFVSPIQDHVRHMLHLGDASWGAAGISGVLVAASFFAMWFLHHAHVPSSWVPFGALALGNTASLAAGLVLARGHRADHSGRARLRLGALVHSGRWLLIVALLPTGAALISAAFVVHLAGSAAMGFAEAGRVFGQPPWVLSMGLAAVLGPRSMRAAQQGRLDEARVVSRHFTMLMLLLGLPYLALVGVPWSWNPLTRLVPNAYHVPHLLLINVIGNMVIGMDWCYRSELIGAGRTSALAKLEAVANTARTAIGATAGLIGAFAIPVGYLTLALVRSVGYRIALRPLYAARSGWHIAEALQPNLAGPEPVLLTGEVESPAP